jgi:hypothetical protein
MKKWKSGRVLHGWELGFVKKRRRQPGIKMRW